MRGRRHSNSERDEVDSLRRKADEGDEGAYWKLVRVLQRRGEPELIEVESGELPDKEIFTPQAEAWVAKRIDEKASDDGVFVTLRLTGDEELVHEAIMDEGPISNVSAVSATDHPRGPAHSLHVTLRVFFLAPDAVYEYLERLIAFAGDEFMQPEIADTDFWAVETNYGTYLVPVEDAVVDTAGLSDGDQLEPEAFDPDDFSDYVEGVPQSATLRSGWFARLSAPDATDWSGPYRTEREARSGLAAEEGTPAPEDQDNARALADSLLHEVGFEWVDA